MSIATEKSPKDVVTDFLASAPTADELIAYRLPDDLQARAHALLDKNREGTLTPAERDEMEEVLQIDHLIALIKAKARFSQT